ncbi:MAG TPA: hypothetical protein VMU75_04470 [Acidimicrobiales bacterium]|nr:hypothetical protein [Acidimicrobiales bacterium]
MLTLAWLWIPVALVITAVIVGSLVVASVADDRRHRRGELGESSVSAEAAKVIAAETRRNMVEDSQRVAA